MKLEPILGRASSLFQINSEMANARCILRRQIPHSGIAFFWASAKNTALLQGGAPSAAERGG
jgi:hypothetical protein